MAKRYNAQTHRYEDVPEPGAAKPGSPTAKPGAPPPAYSGLVNGQTQEEIKAGPSTIAAAPMGGSRGEQMGNIDQRSGEALMTEINARRDGALDYQQGVTAGFQSPIQQPALSTADMLAGKGGNMFTSGMARQGKSVFGGGTAPALAYDNPNQAAMTAKQGPAAPVQTAADAAAAALGNAPQVDMGLADRNLGKLDESLAANKAVLDKALAGPDQSGSRAVLEELLNGESTAQRLGQQTLKTQLAMARSAAGGPGAVADALLNAQQVAPEIQAQATQQAVAERQQRLTAAGDVSQGMATTQNEATNIAGNVGANITNAELGRRQQDVDIAKKNTDTSTTVLGEVARLTGTQLELDQRNKELIGQMARDLGAQNFNWAQLSVQQQNAYFDRVVQTYGIDKNFAAQMKAIAAEKAIGPLDVFTGIMGVVGAGAGVGAAALGKPA